MLSLFFTGTLAQALPASIQNPLFVYALNRPANSYAGQLAVGNGVYPSNAQVWSLTNLGTDVLFCANLPNDPGSVGCNYIPNVTHMHFSHNGDSCLSKWGALAGLSDSKTLHYYHDMQNLPAGELRLLTIAEGTGPGGGNSVFSQNYPSSAYTACNLQ